MFANVDWFDFIVGGIVIGFIVNVAANFAHPKIDAWWAKYSTTQRNKNEAKKRAFDEKVESLINNKHEELIWRIEVNRLATFGIYAALVGVFTMILATMFQPTSLATGLDPYLAAFAGFIGLSRAMYMFSKRNKLVDILNVVDKKLGRGF